MTKYAQIRYGTLHDDIAHLWSEELTPENVRERFERYAGECFGIRKSIEFVHLIEMKDDELPPRCRVLPGAHTVLHHRSDLIIWDKDGNKLKSEWDK